MNPVTPRSTPDEVDDSMRIGRLVTVTRHSNHWEVYFIRSQDCSHGCSFVSFISRVDNSYYREPTPGLMDEPYREHIYVNEATQ